MLGKDTHVIEKEKVPTEENPFVRFNALTDPGTTEKVDNAHALSGDPGRLDSGMRGLSHDPLERD